MSQKLKIIKKVNSGRDHAGHISVRHRGGEHKRFLRLIDWKRNNFDIEGKVVAIEYDPNRTSNIALVHYINGAKAYILSTSKLTVGDLVVSSQKKVAIKDGNRMPIKFIPVGVPIHCIEFQVGKGGQVVKSAGSSAYIQSVDGKKTIIQLPSGEIRIFSSDCMATIGQVSNTDHMNIKLTKAGQRRHRGIRPTVRGVAQHPDSHPHGGGEGRSSIGMHPKTPWGKPAMGKKTRKKKKASNRLIIKHRK